MTMLAPTIWTTADGLRAARMGQIEKMPVSTVVTRGHTVALVSLEDAQAAVAEIAGQYRKIIAGIGKDIDMAQAMMATLGGSKPWLIQSLMTLPAISATTRRLTISSTMGHGPLSVLKLSTTRCTARCWI